MHAVLNKLSLSKHLRTDFLYIVPLSYTFCEMLPVYIIGGLPLRAAIYYQKWNLLPLKKKKCSRIKKYFYCHAYSWVEQFKQTTWML